MWILPSGSFALFYGLNIGKVCFWVYIAKRSDLVGKRTYETVRSWWHYATSSLPRIAVVCAVILIFFVHSFRIVLKIFCPINRPKCVFWRTLYDGHSMVSAVQKSRLFIENPLTNDFVKHFTCSWRSSSLSRLAGGKASSLSRQFHSSGT